MSSRTGGEGPPVRSKKVLFKDHLRFKLIRKLCLASPFFGSNKDVGNDKAIRGQSSALILISFAYTFICR